jgi:hypothetical protein
MTADAFRTAFRPRRMGVLLLAAACNVGVWVLVGIFATSEFYRRSMMMGSTDAWEHVLYVQMCTALIWAAFTPPVVLLAQRLPLRPPHLLRNAVAVIALLPVLAVTRAALGGIILDLGEHHPISAGMIKLSIGIRTHRDIAILAVIFFVSNLVDAQREAAKRERQRVHAQTLLARTELDDLRTRLQPQFALRMLRHIGSVVREEPKAADALIVMLSAILRRSMARGSDEWIRLADELEHLDACLDLCRAGGRYSLTARYVAADDVLSCRVPALVLEPLIETVVLDLTAGAGGSVEVHCTRETHEIHVDAGWTVSPAGTVANTTLRFAYQEMVEIPEEASA